MRGLAQGTAHCPKKCIFWTHQDQEKAKIPYIRVLLVFQKWLDFLQAKEWFFWCFLRPCILGNFCRFIPCNLSRLSTRPIKPRRRKWNEANSMNGAKNLHFRISHRVQTLVSAYKGHSHPRILFPSRTHHIQKASYGRLKGTKVLLPNNKTTTKIVNTNHTWMSVHQKCVYRERTVRCACGARKVGCFPSPVDHGIQSLDICTLLPVLVHQRLFF